MPNRNERLRALLAIALVFLAPPAAHAAGAMLPWWVAYAPLLLMAAWAVLLAAALFVTLLAAHVAPGARPDFRTSVPERENGTPHQGYAGLTASIGSAVSTAS